MKPTSAEILGAYEQYCCGGSKLPGVSPQDQLDEARWLEKAGYTQYGGVIPIGDFGLASLRTEVRYIRDGKNGLTTLVGPCVMSRTAEGLAESVHTRGVGVWAMLSTSKLTPAA